MNKFDGILLATDLDGTLSIDGNVSEENIKAIEYFKSNGGLFTLCTGRKHSYLIKNGLDKLANAPILSFNGAVITDNVTGEILYTGFLTEHYKRAFFEGLKYSKKIKTILVYYKDLEQYVKYDSIKITENTVEFDYLTPIYKIIFTFTDEADALIVRDAINALNLPDIKAVRSWSTCVEIISEKSSKGSTLLWLKNKLNAKMLITAGDFENDVSMLKSADIGFAVENAAPYAKAAADRLTVSVEQNAIAAIIYELESLL